MLAKPNVLVIMGSVRARRRCPQIADLVMSVAAEAGRLACERIDLKDWLLPADDEPEIPAKGNYTQEHTRAWSAKVTGADAIVIVSPQYNWGYPAVLKNALDHLSKEWRGKPLSIITYGGQGGTKCAVQLRQIADALKMKQVVTTPAIRIPREAIENDTPQKPEELDVYRPAITRAMGELADMLG